MKAKEINQEMYAHYHTGIKEAVYETLLNQLVPEFRLPWVEPIFVPGHPCYEQYEHMHEAYTRLRTRLGIEDEDGDAEQMIEALLDHGKILAMEMFRYGRIYQLMQG